MRSNNQDYDFNLGKLVDKYVKLSTGNEDLVNQKSMKEEYEDIKEMAKMSIIEKIELCDDKNHPVKNISINEQPINRHPFTCSLDDSFEIHTNLLNNLNLYP